MRGASLEIGAGEIVGLVGESGSGKSLTALAALGLVPPPGRISGGSIRLGGRELRGLSEKAYRPIRGGTIGLAFQEPGAALNPVLTIGSQIGEAIRAHHAVSGAEARRRAHDLLEQLSMPDPGRRLRQYPHELSGGQRQRAVLAMALAAEPEILIADEPTTALDVTSQAEVLDLLDRLRRDRGLAIVLISHDLGIVARLCDRVVVLYAGEVVEQGEVASLLGAPRHPYTRALLAAVPRIGRGRSPGELRTIPGQVPSPADLPVGCTFHPRCAERRPECATTVPEWRSIGDDAGVRCVLFDPGSEAT